MCATFNGWPCSARSSIPCSPRPSCTRARVSGLGSRVSILGLEFWVLGVGIWGLGFGVWGGGFGVWGSGFGVSQSGPWILLRREDYQSSQRGSNECGTYKTVKARICPWLSAKSPLNPLRCSPLLGRGSLTDLISQNVFITWF